MQARLHRPRHLPRLRLPPTEPITKEDGTGFTQNGNSVTRDLLYDKYSNKQFITIETRNGETFYLVIDYDKPLDEDGERYETYFLNLVDEADPGPGPEAQHPGAGSRRSRRHQVRGRADQERPCMTSPRGGSIWA